MKEITIKLFDYDELSDEAKKRAYDDWLSDDHDHFWGGEVRDTLKKLEEELGIEVTNWSYNSCSYDVGPIRFKDYSDDQLALTGIRAQAFLWNNFAHLVMQPKKRWYSKHIDGRLDLSGCIHCDSGWKNLNRESKVFYERTYNGTCPLTGVCFDNDALDPLAYFCFGVEWDEKAKKRVMIPQSRRMRWGVTTVEDVLRACVDSLFESAQRDCEYQNSEEYFAEMCSNNGWTFEENGERRDAA